MKQISAKQHNERILQLVKPISAVSVVDYVDHILCNVSIFEYETTVGQLRIPKFAPQTGNGDPKIAPE